MTATDFCALNSEDKKKLLLQRGVRLISRANKDVRAVLFGLDGFYVEVLYNLQSKNIVWINAFDRLDFLDPYLQEIDISSLV